MTSRAVPCPHASLGSATYFAAAYQHTDPILTHTHKHAQPQPCFLCSGTPKRTTHGSGKDKGRNGDKTGRRIKESVWRNEEGRGKDDSATQKP